MNFDSVISVKIKTIENKLYNFRLSPTSLVLHLKQEIQKTIGLPISRQKVIFRGRLLPDNQTLAQNNVRDGHTLNLVAKLTPQQMNANIQFHQPAGESRNPSRAAWLAPLSFVCS